MAEEVGNPNIGILYDTFHANIEEKSIAAGIAQGRKVSEVDPHMRNDRGIPVSGHVEWASVFDATRQLRCDGWLTKWGWLIPCRKESFSYRGLQFGNLSPTASSSR